MVLLRSYTWSSGRKTAVVGQGDGFCSCHLVLRGHLPILGGRDCDGEGRNKRACYILIAYLIAFIFERMYAPSEDSKCSGGIQRMLSFHSPPLVPSSTVFHFRGNRVNQFLMFPSGDVSCM